MSALKAHIAHLLSAALDALKSQSNLDFEALTIQLERPKNKAHGDFSSNLAMLLSKQLKQNPRVIAEQLIAKGGAVAAETATGGVGMGVPALVTHELLSQRAAKGRAKAQAKAA